MPETIPRRQTEHPHNTDTSATAEPNSEWPATFQRGLPASWLFALIRPDDAAGITIGRETLALTTPAGQREIRIRDTGAISTVDQWFWRGVRIRTRRGEANISGLNRHDATTAKTAIEEAQTSWWRGHLSEHARTVTALDSQLAGLDTPQGRLGPKTFRSRIEELRRQAAALPKRWPKKINAVPLAVAITGIRTMLDRADTALRRAKQISEIDRVDTLLHELNEPKNIVANFLYVNGIRYEYERPYEHMTATRTRRQYRPDFCLPDEGIYIEHFALSEDGRTPEFIDEAKYTADRNWKLELHEKYGTTLVQTFSHEQRAGRLTEALAEKLRGHGVALRPIPCKRVFAKLNEQGRVKALTQLTATFLKHFKGSRLSMKALGDSATLKDTTGRAEAFLRVFDPIFRRYQAKLAQAGEIDFHDMINRAADHVTAGRYHSPFGYILVDEFQDISRGRAVLLNALLERSPTAQLFAVGDDWQAIYRFAGADTSVMREFNGHFGAGARTILETTFRCADGVCEVATDFIRRNPAQIEKNVRPVTKLAGPGVLVRSGQRKRDEELRETIGLIATDAADSEGRSTILLLGRYKHLEPQLARLRREYAGLDITYRTVHSAKGLEADYVVLIGMQAGRYGFPSEISDDPLLDLVLGTPEDYPNGDCSTSP